MRNRSANARGRTGRLIGAVAVALTLILGTGSISFARPSKQDLEAAQAQLSSLNRQLDLLVEQYNQAKVELDKTQKELADARDVAARAHTESEAARAQLSLRAAAAYESAGMEIEAILGATTLADASDRIEFMNTLVQQNADAATLAETKRQEAIRAQGRLNEAIAKQNTLMRSISDKTAAIKAGIKDQEALVAHIQIELAKPIPKPKPVQTLSQQSPNPSPTQPSGGGGGGGGGPPPSPEPSPPPPPPPPPPGGGAGTAVAAAYSVIGVPYVWGGADPNVGFDCSGLTMWSWAQAGVSLPHSSSMQYAVLPHVSRSDLQPGDLVFFYHPISHVGMYVGGGMMIHSPHVGGHVEKVSFDNYPDFVGAARPG